jgi:hypothetical protein
MPSLINDSQLQVAELVLLEAAARHDRRALRSAVVRFHPVVLGLAYYRSKDLGIALCWVDGVVRSLFDALLAGTLTPAEFAREADRRLAVCQQVGQGVGNGPSGVETASDSESLHSLHGARKLVRRRAGARAIDQLPLGPLMAATLRYHAGWTSAQMIGIVADTHDGVRDMLATAHRAVVDAMRGQE